MGWVVTVTPLPIYTRERPGTHCIGGWVNCKTVLDGCVKSRPLPGIRSPDRPARSESLYRLSYPGPLRYNVPSTFSRRSSFLWLCHKWRNVQNVSRVSCPVLYLAENTGWLFRSSIVTSHRILTEVGMPRQTFQVRNFMKICPV